MMKNRRNKGRLPLSLWLSYLLIATMIFTGVTFSGYVTAVEGGDEARVAQHVFTVTNNAGQNDWVLDIQELKYPGAKKEVQLTVANNKNGKTSEVQLDYTVNIQAEGDIPLTCELKQGDGTIITAKNQMGMLEFSPAPSGSLSAGVEDSDSYTLTLSWPENENDIKYANGNHVVILRVSVTGEQVD